MTAAARIRESRRALGTYQEARRRGCSPRSAVAYARDVVKALAVLPRMSHHSSRWCYDVDVEALARETAGPVLHVTRPDGTHPDGTVMLPAGSRARIEVLPDDRGWEDEECYDEGDYAAWLRDEWHFRGVVATVTLADGREGEASVWGVDVGPYWIGVEESQIWHVLPDLLAEALDEADEQDRQVTIARDVEAEVLAALIAWRDALEGDSGDAEIEAGVELARLLSDVTGIEVEDQ